VQQALREFREYFSFVFNSLLCVCELGCIGAFGFEWFCLYYSLYSLLLIVNFSWIVSASGCRLVKPNHLNLGVS
jgi:hypothetical protein